MRCLVDLVVGRHRRYRFRNVALVPCALLIVIRRGVCRGRGRRGEGFRDVIEVDDDLAALVIVDRVLLHYHIFILLGRG